MANKVSVTEAKPRFSVQGWTFWQWLKGKKGTILEVAKLGIPLVISWLATKSPAWTGFFTILGNLVLDYIHYWINEH